MKVYQVNDPVTFSGKPMGFEEFLIRMVDALQITIDKPPKGRPNIIEKY